MKKHIWIVLAVLLPLVLILVLLAVVYLPKSLDIKYDFLYATCGGGNRGGCCSSYDCDGYTTKIYKVEDGRLIKTEIDPNLDSDKDGVNDVNEGYVVRLFLHDHITNESREITFDDARGLKLSGLITSPDGVTVERMYDRSVEVFPFVGGSSSNDYYYRKGDKREEANVIGASGRYYYDDYIYFISWVIN